MINMIWAYDKLLKVKFYPSTISCKLLNAADIRFFINRMGEIYIKNIFFY